MLIDEELLDARFRSFFMSENLVCEILVLFFNFSISGWVSLTISDGVSNFIKLDSEPSLLELSEINDEFAYPVKSLSGLGKYCGLQVSSVREYRISDIDEGCVGVYMDFGDIGFSIIESEECLSVVEDMVKFSDRKISLIDMSP